MQAVLELKNITKEYPGVKALDHISIQFYPGEVHALMGENGAGKSTLIKTISGAVRPNAGSIYFEGTEYGNMTPALSQKLGIGVIYQEFNLVPELSIAENIFLGQKLKKGLTIDRRLMNQKAEEIMKEFGIEIDVTAPVKSLTVAYQQLVEIAKTITGDVKVLIMDEPSAPLTTREIEAMFGIVNKLKEKGVSVIYISHRMEEIFRISDRITIMRDGQYIGTKLTKEMNRQELINMMVGRTLEEQFPKADREIGEVALEVKHLYTHALLKDISFISIKGISKGSIVNRKKDKELSNQFIERLRIKTPSMEQLTRNLSGGNQQKVVLAKSLAGKSDIIIFDEPTRGIDVGAKQEIYVLMNELAREGMAIIMISSEMPELLGMSDRIVVMHEGEVTGELSKEEATQAKILDLASGK